MQEFLGRAYFGNTILDYLICLAFFIGGVLIGKLCTTIVMRRLKKDLGHKFEYIYSPPPLVNWEKQIDRVSKCDIYIEACNPFLLRTGSPSTVCFIPSSISLLSPKPSFLFFADRNQYLLFTLFSP